MKGYDNNNINISYINKQTNILHEQYKKMRRYSNLNYEINKYYEKVIIII